MDGSHLFLLITRVHIKVDSMGNRKLYPTTARVYSTMSQQLNFKWHGIQLFPSVSSDEILCWWSTSFPVCQLNLKHENLFSVCFLCSDILHCFSVFSDIDQNCLTSNKQRLRGKTVLPFKIWSD